MKKVLYIYLGNFDVTSGITNKLKGLFFEFDNQRVDWVLFTLSSATEKEGFINNNVYVLPYSQNNNLSFVYDKLDSFIKNAGQFDVYFFRYPLATKELISFLRLHPGKFIFEHNTKEIPEIKERAIYWIKKFNFRLTPSYLNLVLNTYIKPVFQERYYGVKAIRMSKKGVAVTDEIARYERSRYHEYDCSVLSNGINVKKVNFYNRTFNNGDKLNLVMLL